MKYLKIDIDPTLFLPNQSELNYSVRFILVFAESVGGLLDHYFELTSLQNAFIIPKKFLLKDAIV